MILIHPIPPSSSTAAAPSPLALTVILLVSPSMPIAVSYESLRHAVAHLLLADNLHGILCSFDCLVMPLDTLRISVSNFNVASINHELLVSAFKSDENEYILPYSHHGISGDGGNEHYLLVRCAD